MSGWRPAALLASWALIAAACGSGESILQAGREDDAPPTAAPVQPGDTTPDGGTPGVTAPGSAPTGEGEGSVAPPGTVGPVVTEQAPTTTITPLKGLPDCPTTALDDDPAATADGPVDVLFWHGLSAINEETLAAITDRYNASQSRVRIQLENQGSYNDSIAKFAQASDADRPDLVMFPEYAAQRTIDSGAVIPIGACLEEAGLDTSTFQQSALAAYATAGVQWGMPFNVSNPVLYYNKTMFAAAGLDPERPPRSLAELREYSQQIVDSGAASFGIALESGSGSGGGWFLEQWFANAGALYADNGNGRLAPATEVLFDGQTGVEVLTYVQSLVADGLAAYVGDNPSSQDQLLKMADGAAPAAMAIATSSFLGQVIAIVDGGLIPGVTGADIGIGPLPGPSGVPTALVGGNALYIVDHDSDARAAAAWEFLSYLISPEVQAEIAAATGYVPMREESLALEPLASLYQDDPRFRVAYDQLIGTPDDPALRGPLLGPHLDIRVITSSAIAAILNGADVATELANAAARANESLADYNARN